MQDTEVVIADIPVTEIVCQDQDDVGWLTGVCDRDRGAINCERRARNRNDDGELSQVESQECREHRTKGFRDRPAAYQTSCSSAILIIRRAVGR